MTNTQLMQILKVQSFKLKTKTQKKNKNNNNNKKNQFHRRLRWDGTFKFNMACEAAALKAGSEVACTVSGGRLFQILTALGKYEYE